MKAFTLQEAAAALGLPQMQAQATLADVCTDTRKIQPGSLFVCLRGERFDGHSFASQAAKLGAAALLVDHPVNADVPQLVVTDTGKALLQLAGWYRRRFQLPVVGLTSWKHYIMPVVALAFYPTAYIARLMRSSMLDVLGQDYMRTARAKGLSQSKSLFKHALRNAVLPVVTYVGPMVAYTMTGSFVVEKIFTIPGLGGEFVGSILNRDYTIIMGTTIFLAALVIFMNVVVDLVYKLVDPRIQLK